MNMGFMYIGLTIIFTVYGQLVLRWQMSQAGVLPPGVVDKVVFLLSQFTNMWILSCFASAFVAALCWMAAVTRMELSFAYPFMSLSFVAVVVLAPVLLGEYFSWYKVVGTLTIVGGLFILTR